MIKWLVGTIMAHALQHEIESDATTRQYIRSRQRSIDQLTEAIDRDLDVLAGAQKRKRVTRKCTMCGTKATGKDLRSCPACGSVLPEILEKDNNT